jgi:hypothetical protein
MRFVITDTEIALSPFRSPFRFIASFCPAYKMMAKQWTSIDYY